MTDVLEELVKRALLEHAVSTETLTQEQFIEAIKQAVKAGDFIRMVHAGTDPMNHGQTVVYHPYAERHRLEARIESLCETLQLILVQRENFSDDAAMRIYELASVALTHSLTHSEGTKCMKFTESADGRMRTNIRVTIRLSDSEIEYIRGDLAAKGKPCDDKAVREFVRDFTEFNPPVEEEDDHGGGLKYR